MIIANWKMQKTYLEATIWCQNNKDELSELTRTQDVEFVLCPSFDSLSEVKKILNETRVKFGAQNCSTKEKGAYTGEISASSIKEIGCSYCIIGHSERRIYFKETNQDIAQKATLLLKNKITPVICIGETEQEKQKNETLTVIVNQLTSILEVVKEFPKSRIIFAYEPIWAIGTAKIPLRKELENTLSNIRIFINQHYPLTYFSLFYGGSVNQNNIDEFVKINEIDGYLLGTSSLDFQEIKNIVLLLKEHKKFRIFS